MNTATLPLALAPIIRLEYGTRADTFGPGVPRLPELARIDTADARFTEEDADELDWDYAYGEEPNEGMVTFRFNASDAERVKLAADFTGWEQQPLDLRRTDDGTWQIVVELPRGQYSYRFLVDNQWCDDPRCPDYEPNPYGGYNSVIAVR
jgi:1,4-alpha-glucan branching enzyme